VRGKRGRPPKGARAMTSTERSTASRRRMREKLDRVTDILRRFLDAMADVTVVLSTNRKYDNYIKVRDEAEKELES
jgi:hypothetical protein